MGCGWRIGFGKLKREDDEMSRGYRRVDTYFATQGIIDAGASTTYLGNSIFIMENSDLGGCETLETPNMFLNPSI